MAFGGCQGGPERFQNTMQQLHWVQIAERRCCRCRETGGESSLMACAPHDGSPPEGAAMQAELWWRGNHVCVWASKRTLEGRPHPATLFAENFRGKGSVVTVNHTSTPSHLRSGADAKSAECFCWRTCAPSMPAEAQIWPIAAPRECGAQAADMRRALNNGTRQNKEAWVRSPQSCANAEGHKPPRDGGDKATRNPPGTIHKKRRVHTKRVRAVYEHGVQERKGNASTSTESPPAPRTLSMRHPKPERCAEVW